LVSGSLWLQWLLMMLVFARWRVDSMIPDSFLYLEMLANAMTRGRLSRLGRHIGRAGLKRLPSEIHPPSTNRWRFFRSKNFPISSPTKFDGLFYAIVRRWLFGATLNSFSWKWKVKDSLRKSKQWWRETFKNERRRIINALYICNK